MSYNHEPKARNMCIPKKQHFSLTPWKLTRHNTVGRMSGRRRIFCGRTLVPESRVNKDWCVASLQDKSSSSKRGAGEPACPGLRYTMIILFPISTYMMYSFLALSLANLVRKLYPSALYSWNIHSSAQWFMSRWFLQVDGRSIANTARSFETWHGDCNGRQCCF